MPNICIPQDFSTAPKEAAKYLQSIQDLGYEAASVFIESHNSLMRLMFLFGKMEEIDMGSQLPKMLVSQGFQSIFGHITEKVRRHLP